MEDRYIAVGSEEYWKIKHGHNKNVKMETEDKSTGYDYKLPIEGRVYEISDPKVLAEMEYNKKLYEKFYANIPDTRPMTLKEIMKPREVGIKMLKEMAEQYPGYYTTLEQILSDIEKGISRKTIKEKLKNAIDNGA